uniref:BTB domain-containing protein n=1 Tax=Chromera velia CCMP2878 TaxID=1169474 RepID=A0A0G4HKT3_9ALVE|eukprot:Cvel_28536.t1-p1 / transcript=Cvel_28536.t1 / gene=Cvel_28536 / organism=Chromera_velia_CCMP2878 / gene_product=hypothetical protein / transcript_product=hypothetical protein / location=Cvel_scaffold3757:2261-2884(-) / protein_length=208 / sequence_SO=supercontig / SO=protein_coding / is_pseudo=false
MAESSVTLVLREREEVITLSKALLIRHSEYFRAMLERDHFREGSDAAVGEAVTVTAEWLRAETFGYLPVLLHLGDQPGLLKIHFRGLWDGFPSTEHPNSVYALLKMCDYFQIDTHVERLLKLICSAPERWGLDVLPVLLEVRPGLLESKDFPFERLVRAVVWRLRQGGEDEKALASFPPDFLMRVRKDYQEEVERASLRVKLHKYFPS